MIEGSRKELNDDQIDLSKLLGFKIKTNRILTVKFEKEELILSTAFPWTNQVLLSDIDVPCILNQVLNWQKLFYKMKTRFPHQVTLRRSSILK